MRDSITQDEARPDVAVVGGGPSGLAIATALRRLGVHHVTVLDREPAAGGVPRHCGHPPFGMREFGRILSGPKYAERLVERALAAGVDLRPGTTVASIHAGPRLVLGSTAGMAELRAKRVVLATGVRETPRAARLVSGTRPLGVITTGALQSTVYLGNRVPCTRPVIIGSELVSFSALLTCRHAGIHPVAMVEARSRPTAWRVAALLPRMQGIPLLVSTRLERIEGRQRVSGVIVREPSGISRRIPCDGVVFSGCFVAESTLARMGHLVIDDGTGGPAVDNRWRCSDPDYFAVGNLVHPADSAGSCWREGNALARFVASSLEEDQPAVDAAVTIETASPAIRYVSPQRLARGDDSSSAVPLRVRFAAAGSGHVSLLSGDRAILRRRVHALPESQVRLILPWRALSPGIDSLQLRFDDD